MMPMPSNDIVDVMTGIGQVVFIIKDNDIMMLSSGKFCWRTHIDAYKALLNHVSYNLHRSPETRSAKEIVADYLDSGVVHIVSFSKPGNSQEVESGCCLHWYDRNYFSYRKC
jgi:hypothetical protein